MTAVAVKSLQCPHCGAPQELRTGARAQVLVCPYCDAAIDLTDPNYAILHQYGERVKYTPYIPLGKRGTVKGELLECVGYLHRSAIVDGETFSWSEYLLYNPFIGYRWLVHDQGSWTFVRESMKLPTDASGNLLAVETPQAHVNYDGRTYQHFQTSIATVDFALGEFYWKITAGQQTTNTDYTAPPMVLSAEWSENEVTWSSGQTIPEEEVTAAFSLEAPATPTSHVGMADVNPVGGAARWWSLYAMLVMAGFLMTSLFAMTAKQQVVFHHEGYVYSVNEKERSFVTDIFLVPAPIANLQVTMTSGGLDNRWAFYTVTLINNDTNTAYDFGISNDYYHGVEDGESWVEATTSASQVVPCIPTGNYYLRIEPESGTGETAEPHRAEQPDPGPPLFQFNVNVVKDVPQWSLWGYFCLWLLPIPIIQSIRSWSFEIRRS